MNNTNHLEAIQVEETDTPRPHSKVRSTSHSIISDATAGRIPDEITVTVHLSIDGGDLQAIKQATIEQAIDNIKVLM